jgi:ATP-dependent RNA helicase SUPV3L1/SUV3
LVARFIERTRKNRSRAKSRPRSVHPDTTPPARNGFDHPFEKLLEMKIALAPTPQAPVSAQQKWAQSIVDARYRDFSCDERGVICFQNEPVARMTRGADLLRPEVRLLCERELGAGGRLQVQRRMSAWTRDLVDEILGPLRRGYVRDLSPAGKGLVYQLEQGLGTALAVQASEQLRHLTARDRELIRRMGVYIGYRVVFVRDLLKPGSVLIRFALCAAYYDLRSPPFDIKKCVVSARIRSGIGTAVYLAVGYPVLGPRAVRADLVERFSAHLHQLSRRGPFSLSPELGSSVGCPVKELPLIAEALGYQRGQDGLYRKTDEPLERRIVNVEI